MKRINSNRVFLGILQSTILFFCMINYIFHDIAFANVIKVFLYQFLGWFVVGYGIFKFMKIQVNNFAEAIAFSYSLGAIFSLIIYMLFMLMGISFALPFFTLAESICVGLYIYKFHNDGTKYKADTFSMLLCIGCLLAYYMLSTCAVSFINTMPNETAGGVGYYVDWPFWAGNNIAFTKSFPSDCFRQVGVPWGYHYFSSILMAQVALCTGVDINQISFYFSSILAGIIFIFSGYYFATRVLKRKLFTVILMCAALFTDGTTVTYAWHTLICPFGFDYGYAYGMMSIAVLAEILVNNRFKELFIPSVFFIAMTTGCKGPIGVVVLGAYGIASISFLLQRKMKKGVISGCTWLISFSSVYYAFIRDTWITDTAAGLQYIGGLGINTVVKNAVWIAEIYNSIISAYRIQGDRILVKLYAVWLFIYRSNKIIFTLLLIALITLIGSAFIKKFDALLYSLVISSIVGILLTIYTAQSGSSQMYFLMGIFPAASMAGAYAVEKLWKCFDSSTKMKYLYKSVMVVVLCTLGISLNRYYEIVIPRLREGVAIIRDRYTQADYMFGRFYIDGIDYEAFNWIKNNTDKRCIVAIDSFVESYGKDNHMIAGIFSQRYVWNEEKYVPDLEEADRRNAIIQSLMSDTNNSLRKMKEEKVSYLISQIAVGKEEIGKLTNNLTEVFRNEHYIIYRL